MLITLRKKTMVFALVVLLVPALATFIVNVPAAMAWNRCTASSSIQSNFNGTPIAGGTFIWFTSVIKVQGLPSSPQTVIFQQQTIKFTANGTSFTLHVPNGSVQFVPGATSATTTFNTTTHTWGTTVPSSIGGNTFLSGLAFHVPAGGLPGGINPVTWSGVFSLPKSVQLTVNWQWAAAVYSTFSTTYNALGVKPVDDNQLSQYKNSDHAGTPENFKSDVIGGARGGGGSNYTGSLSATASATCG